MLIRLNLLTYLDLNRNNLKLIYGLKNLVNLEFLDISNNQIVKIDEICRLYKLKILLFRNNKVTDILPLSFLVNL